jgi:hypothetical protein
LALQPGELDVDAALLVALGAWPLLRRARLHSITGTPSL